MSCTLSVLTSAPLSARNPKGQTAIWAQHSGSRALPALQVSGEAKYTDDMPLPPGGLHAVLVMSTKPHARLVSVDPSQALMVGPHACCCAHRSMCTTLSAGDTSSCPTAVSAAATSTPAACA